LWRFFWLADLKSVQGRQIIHFASILFLQSALSSEFRNDCEANAVNTVLRGGFWPVGGPRAWVQDSCHITVGGRAKILDANNDRRMKQSGSIELLYAYTNS
jgi:hypothetical protein